MRESVLVERSLVVSADTGRCEGAIAEKAVPFPDTVHRSSH
jgi:hypothetical protein